jgi:hypothetical protein
MNCDLIGVYVDLPGGAQAMVELERIGGREYRMTVPSTGETVGTIRKLKEAHWESITGEVFYTQKNAVRWSLVFHLLGVEWNVEGIESNGLGGDLGVCAYLP